MPGLGQLARRCRRSRRSRPRARPGRARTRRCRVLSDTDSSARAIWTSPGAVGPYAEARCRARFHPPSTLPRDQHSSWIRRVEADRPPGDQPHRLRQQLVLDRVQPRRAPRPASRASGSSIARCRITGPVSTPPSTKWTVTPNTLTPYASACCDALQPRERRQQRRMDVDHPVGERVQERAAQQLHVARRARQLGATPRATSPPSRGRAPPDRRQSPRAGTRARGRLCRGALERGRGRLVRRHGDDRDRRRGRAPRSSSACRFVPVPEASTATFMPRAAWESARRSSAASRAPSSSSTRPSTSPERRCANAPYSGSSS